MHGLLLPECEQSSQVLNESIDGKAITQYDILTFIDCHCTMVCDISLCSGQRHSQIESSLEKVPVEISLFSYIRTLELEKVPVEISLFSYIRTLELEKVPVEISLFSYIRTLDFLSPAYLPIKKKDDFLGTLC